MKIKLLFTVAFLSFCSMCLAQDNTIVGKWAAESRSKGGLGAMFVFSENGTANYSFGALIDFDYQVKNNTLKYTFKNPDTGQLESGPTEEFFLTPNKLIINPSDPQKKTEMTRVGSAIAGQNSIVGSWSFNHPSGGDAVMQYSKSGRALLHVQMKVFKGTYQLSSQELTIRFEGRPTTTQKIKLESNRLVLEATADRKEEEFTRLMP